MSSKLPATPEELFHLLDQLEITHKTARHEAVFTVDESAHVTASIPGAHTKNLFVKDKKGNFFLLVVGNHSRIALNHVHSVIGAQSRVSFANADLLMELLGITPGSVNAFAPMNDHDGKVRVIIDKPLLENQLINCHPLTNTMTTTISTQDLLRFLAHVKHEPLVLQLSEET
jgi:Ala-tRNA(Pro) deacylase